MDSKLFSLTVLLVISLYFLSPAESQGCPEYCPAVANPVCAVNSSGRVREFGNSCQTEVYNCKNNESFKIIRYGVC
ncbi:U-Kazal-Dg21.2-like isoform X2 [Lycorma delicatula]